MTDLRARILEVATSEIGPQAKGSAKVEAYWRDVLPPEWTDAQVHLYAKTKEWCGGFALWCLRAAGLAQGIHWHDGVGFLGPAHLRPTKTPSQCDIGVKPQPFAHHWVFKYEYDGWLYGIGGNTPGVKEQRFRRDEVVVYSISPLLPDDTRETDPAPPLPAHPTLKLGAHGEPVKLMQRLLNEANPNGHPIAEDGSFGSITAAILQSFQRRAGLDADAVVGPKTWAVLEKTRGTNQP